MYNVAPAPTASSLREHALKPLEGFSGNEQKGHGWGSGGDDAPVLVDGGTVNGRWKVRVQALLVCPGCRGAFRRRLPTRMCSLCPGQ